MVQDVNAGQVAPEERLSDHEYMYDSQEKDKLAEKKAEVVKNEAGLERPVPAKSKEAALG